MFFSQQYKTIKKTKIPSEKKCEPFDSTSTNFKKANKKRLI